MKVTISAIKLTNFKGIRSFEATFNGDVTDFRGDNATGKTTLFDAFTWCLYGKDSLGKSNFEVKTLDENNEVIWKQPHEVSVLLRIDGDPVEIRKSFKEVWTKKRGKAVEEFTGHTVDRFWNDVPIKEKEFNEKISEICKEETFRLITNPFYFLTQMKTQDQRNFLIDLAGEITPETIAAKYPEFQTLVEQLSGKTAEEFNREIAAQIKRIKTENETLPARIDERKRDQPEAENWSDLQSKIEDKQNDIGYIEKQKRSLDEKFKAVTDDHRALLKKKSDLEIQLTKKRAEIETEITKDFYAQQTEQKRLQTELQKIRAAKEFDERQIESCKKEDALAAGRREELVAEFRQIKTRSFDRDSIDRSQFVCPTCKRPLEDFNIDEQIDRMEANFNKETSRLLEENKQKGLSVKATREKIAERQASHEASICRMNDEMNALKMNPLLTQTLEKPDTSHIDERIEIKTLKDLIAEADENVQNHVVEDPETYKLDARIKEIQNEISDLRVRLGKKEIIERNEARIEELQKQFQSQNETIAALEGIQFQIAEFKKTLIGEVESTINAMFKYVKFKMYETQINGGERETCEALVNGVPYSTNVNFAARVNAGLDIINAISEHENVFAPIFVDNRESVTHLIDTQSQIVNLIKDENYQILTRM